MNVTGRNPLSAMRFLYYMPRFIRVFSRLWRDSRVPWVAKLIPVVALLYLVSPIDLSADFIPFVGHVDDLAVLLIAFRAFVKLSPHAVVQEHLSAVSGQTAS